MLPSHGAGGGVIRITTGLLRCTLRLRVRIFLLSFTCLFIRSTRSYASIQIQCLGLHWVLGTQWGMSLMRPLLFQCLPAGAGAGRSIRGLRWSWWLMTDGGARGFRMHLEGEFSGPGVRGGTEDSAWPLKGLHSWEASGRCDQTGGMPEEEW